MSIPCILLEEIIRKTNGIELEGIYTLTGNLPKIPQANGLNEYYLYILAPSHPKDIYT